MRPVPRGARNTRRPLRAALARSGRLKTLPVEAKPRPYITGWLLCGWDGSAAVVQIKDAAGLPLGVNEPAKAFSS